TPTPTPTPKKMDMDMPMDKDSDSHQEHKMDMPSDMKMDEEKPTSETELEDYPFPLPPPGKDFPSPIEDSRNHSFVLFELLEYQATANSKNALNWDMIGWYGGDYNRFWFRSEGEIEQASKSSGDVEFQGLYGRMIAPFYDFQVGLRYDQKWEGGERNSRFHAVVGLVGLVPYEYEVEPLMFISNKGDVSFRFTGVKDILINQRTIFEGRFETNIAVQKVPKFGVGAGLNDMEFGIRIRREISREFASYIGVSYKRLFSGTADFARLEGGRADKLSLVAGVRLWF
ncbi:MAG: copper resistance protein B, partial [Aridibacter sp.]